jgi:hypothetical protein
LLSGAGGLAGPVLAGLAGRLVVAGTVRAAGGAVAGLAGLLVFRAGVVLRRAGEGPGVGDAGLAALDPGGGAVLLHREQRVAGGGLAGPGGVRDDGDGAARVGRQRGVNGRCRADGAVPGAGAGSGAGCAALGAVSGLVLVRAISWLHFISGGILICLSPVISGQQSLCTGHEVKPLRGYFLLPPETNECPARRKRD